MDPNQLKSFLDKISQIESSRGKNINHPMIRNGIQKGSAAIGQYGLMPNSIQEELNRMKGDNTSTPELDQLKDQPEDDVRAKLADNKDLEQAIAAHLANRISDKQGGNDLASAYAWNNGSNLSPDRIGSKQLLNSDYVHKFSKLNSDEAVNNSNDQQNMQEQARNRALDLLKQGSNGASTLQNPASLEDADKAIQNLEEIRNKKLKPV